jgi:hypothetical protein
MKFENIENMQRAVGILEGAAFCADDKVQSALVSAIDILDAILDDIVERKDA